MNYRFSTFACRSIAAVMLSATALPALAQDGGSWPADQITIIVPFGAGGSSDQLGRILAEGLSEKYGQRVVVENRPGNAGITGSQLVARAEPDGYTLVVSGIASHVIAPVVNSSVPYDPIEDFTHIAFLGGPPTVLAVANNSGIDDFADLVETAKTAEPRLRYGVPGYGTHGHLVGEYFQQLAELEFEPVAYESGAEASIDLLGGHVPVSSNSLLSTAQHLQSGGVRGIAVTSEERLESYPDLPTFVELGYPDLVAMTWFSISGPAGIPEDVVTQLNADIREVLNSEEVASSFREDGVLINDFDVPAFNEFIAAETEKWTAIAEGAGIQAQ